MNQTEFDYCKCICHDIESASHCMPCCRQCPECGRGIKVHSFSDHVERCQKDVEKIKQLIKKCDEKSYPL